LPGYTFNVVVGHFSVAIGR